jgi:hypothetical protein
MTRKRDEPTLPGVFTPAQEDVTPSPAGLEEGERRRDAGLARAETNEELSLAIDHALYAACLEKPEVSSDDIWLKLPLTVIEKLPKYPNAIGAAMRRAALAGWIVDTGRAIKTERPNGHARRIPVWRSIV